MIQRDKNLGTDKILTRFYLDGSLRARCMMDSESKQGVNKGSSLITAQSIGRNPLLDWRNKPAGTDNSNQPETGRRYDTGAAIQPGDYGQILATEDSASTYDRLRGNSIITSWHPYSSLTT